VTGATLVEAGGGCAAANGGTYGFTSFDGSGAWVVTLVIGGIDSSGFKLAEACVGAGFGGCSRV
jgi:hypothetical protein